MSAPEQQSDDQQSDKQQPEDERRRRAAGGRRRGQPSLASVGTFMLAAAGVLTFYTPPRDLLKPPFARIAEAATLPAAAPSANAFGRSGEVRVRFALPNEALEYPLDVGGDPRSLAYQWVRVGERTSGAAPRPLAGAEVVAPATPGFYQLALARIGVDSVAGIPAAEPRVIPGLTLAVLVPFSEKLGATLDGYRIGTYVAERLKGGEHDRPAGFVRVDAGDLNLPLSKHLRLGDFVTHDDQQVWPRYAALNPRLLDKLELVLAEIASWRGDTANVDVALDVHSGFRTPLYNRTVKRSAKDSRHQYGDAADVTIDANGDGRYTLADSKLIVRAVEAVESAHPDLVGGLGLYTSRRYRTPYVHIDARGQRARWRG
ncbi:MAG: hypothetical protein ACJ79S_15525 [Gemmatimonadaceae bacterium]